MQEGRSTIAHGEAACYCTLSRLHYEPTILLQINPTGIYVAPSVGPTLQLSFLLRSFGTQLMLLLQFDLLAAVPTP